MTLSDKYRVNDGMPDGGEDRLIKPPRIQHSSSNSHNGARALVKIGNLRPPTCRCLCRNYVIINHWDIPSADGPFEGEELSAWS